MLGVAVLIFLCIFLLAVLAVFGFFMLVELKGEE